MVGLKDIADRANVSVATVSRVLSRPHLVAPRTAQRVQRVADELKYRPNLLVSGMQTGRTGTVGVIARGWSDFEGKVILGIERALGQADCVPIVVFHSKRDGPEQELQLLHRLLDRRVDGVIVFASHERFNLDHHAEVWDRRVPLVWIGRDMPGDRGDHIGSDNRGAAAAAVDHLVSLGHRVVGHLAGTLCDGPERQRLEGFRAATHHRLGAPGPVAEAATWQDGYAAALQLLSAPQRPTAVFAANDYLAMSVYHAAAVLGLNVPEDLSVVGMADLEFGPYMAPPLTTISQQSQAIGMAAAEQLLRRTASDNPVGPRERVLVPTQLVIRDSTSPLLEKTQ